jgi:hypothetical protein
MWCFHGVRHSLPCRAMGLDGLWKPDLRARIEAQIRDVAAGVVTKAQVGGSVGPGCIPQTS